MKLLGSLGSPYVRKVRIVLAEKKLEAEFIDEDVWADNTQIQAINPLGKIPALIIDDGSAVFDSRVIAEYLDSSVPGHRLIPPNGRERLQVRRWEALGDGVADAAVQIRFENKMHAPKHRSALWISRQLGKIQAGLSEMERQIGDQTWCVGVSLTLADISMACALGYLDFRFPEIHWRDQCPCLDRHYAKLLTRPSFSETVPPIDS